MATVCALGAPTRSEVVLAARCRYFSLSSSQLLAKYSITTIHMSHGPEPASQPVSQPTQVIVSVSVSVAVLFFFFSSGSKTVDIRWLLLLRLLRQPHPF